jgi:hypothetical protein
MQFARLTPDRWNDRKTHCRAASGVTAALIIRQVGFADTNGTRKTCCVPRTILAERDVFALASQGFRLVGTNQTTFAAGVVTGVLKDRFF